MQLPNDAVVILRDEWDVNELCTYLRRSQRSRIVVVMSTAQRERKPAADPEKLKRRLGAKADVVVISYALAFKLSDRMGKQLSVYGGAARVYPCDDAWLSDFRQAALVYPESTPNATMGAIERAVDREQERMRELARQREREAEERRAREEQERRKREAERAEARRRQEEQAARQAKPAQKSNIAAAGTASAAPARLDLPQNADGVLIADTAERAAHLAAYLCAESSTMPVIIATRNTGMVSSLADTGELSRMLRDAALVVDVIGEGATAELNARMPKGVQTFGNACRVIPAGSAWIKRGGVKLFWGWGMADRERVTDAVLQEAARLSFSHTYSSEQAAADKRKVSGIVLGSPAEGRVLVDLGGGRYATILTRLVSKTVAGDRLFAKGMRVSGLFDDDSRRLDVTEPRPCAPRAALSGYADGMVVLARVRRVLKESCTLELFPDVLVEVSAEDASVGGDLRYELTEGAVMPVRIIERDDDAAAWSAVGDDGAVRLDWLVSLLDVDGRPAAAPGYLPGGPAWIQPEDMAGKVARQSDHAELSAMDERQLSDITPDTADTASAQAIRALFVQLGQARQELATAVRQREAVAAQLEQVKRHALEQSRALKRQSRHLGGGEVPDLRDRFADPRQRLDCDIYLAWVMRIPAADKPNKPLAWNWSYGPGFFDSLDEVQGVEREKVAQVMLEVVLGLDKDLAGRGLHQLRAGDGGADPKRRTAEGDTYWRVYLQVNTPSARRLHYIRRADGSVVFSRIALHDDFRS